jgi:NAD(P)-dependent dehydrogenase (short-subunit alcohol dehydrogenase family)
MNDNLRGQVALLTGPVTPLTVTVARQLGNAGVRLAFAGPNVDDNPELQPVLYQFRRDAVCFNMDVNNVEAAEAVVAETEHIFGQIDIVIHTLGSAHAEWRQGSSKALVWNGSAPLIGALTCSSGAIRHMSRRQHGHVIHLVTRGDVGALEVEKLVQSQLQKTWSQDGAPGQVSLSAIYFEEIGPLLPPPPAQEPRLLEAFTARTIGEDDWASKLFLEQEIGNMVLQVCSQQYTDQPGDVHSFDFTGAHPQMAV